MRFQVGYVLTLIFLWVSPLFTWAQDTGSITGTVRETTGAVIAGAQVTVSSAGGAIPRTATTNSDGDYLVAGLPPGAYDLTIAAPGFKKYEAKGLILRVAEKMRVDTTLQVGDISTEITVQGEGVAEVETQSSEIAGTVTAKELTQLELNGRNFTQLITLVPGVSNQTGLDEGLVGLQGNVYYSVNGGRSEYNNWEIDGGDALDNGSNTTLNVYPSLDSIQEVRVLTSNYGAQYGRSGSGTVEVETKSGTQDFHGDAYEFVRNNIFNARNFFDPPDEPAPPYKKNDFGYTIGGPVYIPGHYNINKDKTFFFWSQEWRRERVPGQTFNQLVPSLAERGANTPGFGDFSDVCPAPGSGVNTTQFPDCPVNPATGAYFKNNQVPIDPNGQALLALIPAPNGTSGGFPVFQGSPTQPTEWRQELVRVDENFTSKLRAMFRYAHDSYDAITPNIIFGSNPFPTVQTHVNTPGTSVVLRLTATPSSTLVNEFVASYTTDHLIMSPIGNYKIPAGFSMTSLFDNGFGGVLPAITLLGGNAYGGGFTEDTGGVPASGWVNSNPTYTLRDNVSKIIGAHNLQFGGYAVFAEKNEPNLTDTQGVLTFDSSSPVSTGNPFADLLLGRISSYTQTNKELKYYNRYKIFEPYFQDDWHATARLTLNLGLRISMFGTYRDISKQTYNWEQSAWNPANAPAIDPSTGALILTAGKDPFNGMVQCGAPGVPPGCMKGHLFNPAPRIGFAYDPTGKGKTSIRAAYGIFWEHTNGNESNTEALEGSAPLVQTVTQNLTPGHTGYTSIGGTGLLFPQSVLSIPTTITWPYVQQWHLDVQHEFRKNTVATIAYVGTQGTHLNLQRDLNEITPVPASQNPYSPGSPINGATDCTTPPPPLIDGHPVTPKAAMNLAVACGADPDLYRPFQGLGNITYISNAASSSYNAMQVSVRRTAGALVLDVAYTYSHNIDDASDRYDTSGIDSYHPERASSSLDQRHILSVSYVYDIPFFHQPDVARKVFGNWQLSGITSFQTGTPFSVINQNGFPDNAGVANELPFNFMPQSYPDLVGDPNAAPAGTHIPGVAAPLIYNPNAFANPTGLTFGDAGRNVLRNPSRTNFDMALFKHIPVRESMSFEFRAEAFNIFNHTQWEPNFAGGTYSALDANFGSPTFLTPTMAHRGRTMQFGAKFLF